LSLRSKASTSQAAGGSKIEPRNSIYHHSKLESKGLSKNITRHQFCITAARRCGKANFTPLSSNFAHQKVTTRALYVARMMPWHAALIDDAAARRRLLRLTLTNGRS
jgi:hypothetical protein